MGTDIKWIKVAVDLFDDEKIMLIESMPDADAILVIWFKLLCFAGKQNNGGIFILNDRIPYTEEMLAAIFRRPLNKIKYALQTFENFGMIEIVNGAVTIPNWKKHQSMIDKKEYDRIAKQRQRERESQLLLTEHVNDNVNDKSMNVKHKNKEERNKNTEKEGKNSRFVPPTVDEVSAYCKERNNSVDPNRFVDWYTARGWKGIKDWKACVRTWERRDKKEEPKEETKFDVDEYGREQGWWE